MNNIKYLSFGCAALLLLAVPSWLPYGFYILLRWVICLVSVYVAYMFYKSNLNGWAFTFTSLALIFNPIIPVYLDKSSWVAIDLIGTTLFFIAAYSSKKNVKV